LHGFLQRCDLSERIVSGFVGVVKPEAVFTPRVTPQAMINALLLHCGMVSRPAKNKCANTAVIAGSSVRMRFVAPAGKWVRL